MEGYERLYRASKAMYYYVGSKYRYEALPDISYQSYISAEIDLLEL